MRETNPAYRKWAIAIAAEAKQNSEPLPPAYMPESLALAFIGTVANGKKPDKRALDFVNMLDSKRISAVALFCTSHNLDGSCLDVLREALKARGHQGHGRDLDLPWQGRPDGRQDAHGRRPGQRQEVRRQVPGYGDQPRAVSRIRLWKREGRPPFGGRPLVCRGGGRRKGRLHPNII